MKAVGFYQYLPVENPESLVEVEIPDLEPSARDLRVRVKAVSVNPVDVKIHSRLQTVEKEPKIIGWDVAGVVESIGREVSLFKVGDEVYYAGDITRPGCNSQYHLVDERIAGRKPDSLSFEQAAAKSSPQRPGTIRQSGAANSVLMRSSITISLLPKSSSESEPMRLTTFFVSTAPKSTSRTWLMLSNPRVKSAPSWRLKTASR